MTSWRQIQKRVTRAELLLPIWKTKIVGLRKLTIGDFSEVEENEAPQLDWGVGRERQTQRNGRLQQCYQVMMKDFQAGLSNGILEGIRTLTVKTAYAMPAIEAEGLHDIEAAIISLYLGVRMGDAPRGCNAVAHHRRSLLHFLIDGVGTTWNTMMEGKPVVPHIDNMDVTFDVDATLWSDHRWRGCYVRRSLGEWLDEFDESHFQDILDKSAESDRSDVLDQVVELHYYFDASGFDGTYCVCRVEAFQDEDMDPILLEANPHYHKIDGFRQPFIPIDMMMFMELPQAPMPIGVVEMAAPHAIMQRLYERVSQITALRSTPFWWAQKGSIDEDAQEQFERGEPEALIFGEQGSQPPIHVASGEMSRTMAMLMADRKQAIVTMMGANPYSSGDKVEGIKYAHEVAAIQVNSGLVEGSAQIEHVGQWKRNARMALWNGKLYDQSPLNLNLDGDVVAFGPKNPIGQYLRGDADLVIADDSTAYASKGQRIQDAEAFVAFAAEVAKVAPGALPMAVERGLRAFGVRNVAKAFQPPAGAVTGQGGADEQAMGADQQAAASPQ